MPQQNEKLGPPRVIPLPFSNRRNQLSSFLSIFGKVLTEKSACSLSPFLGGSAQGFVFALPLHKPPCGLFLLWRVGAPLHDHAPDFPLFHFPPTAVSNVCQDFFRVPWPREHGLAALFPSTQFKALRFQLFSFRKWRWFFFLGRDIFMDFRHSLTSFSNSQTFSLPGRFGACPPPGEPAYWDCGFFQFSFPFVLISRSAQINSPFPLFF